jgi:hypothetical protein
MCICGNLRDERGIASKKDIFASSKNNLILQNKQKKALSRL